MTERIQAEKFKAKCLKLIDKVHRTKKRVIITKKISLPAQLIPIEKEKTSLSGKMNGTIHISGDIVALLMRCRFPDQILKELHGLFFA